MYADDYGVPFFCNTTLVRNISPFISLTTTRIIFAPKSRIIKYIRLCVIGRGSFCPWTLSAIGSVEAEPIRIGTYLLKVLVVSPTGSDIPWW